MYLSSYFVKLMILWVRNSGRVCSSSALSDVDWDLSGILSWRMIQSGGSKKASLTCLSFWQDDWKAWLSRALLPLYTVSPSRLLELLETKGSKRPKWKLCQRLVLYWDSITFSAFSWSQVSLDSKVGLYTLPLHNLSDKEFKAIFNLPQDWLFIYLYIPCM
jgi:hypothetical protein